LGSLTEHEVRYNVIEYRTRIVNVECVILPHNCTSLVVGKEG
jgi:hypothetical protein